MNVHQCQVYAHKLRMLFCVLVTTFSPSPLRCWSLGSVVCCSHRQKLPARSHSCAFPHGMWLPWPLFHVQSFAWVSLYIWEMSKCYPSFSKHPEQLTVPSSGWHILPSERPSVCCFLRPAFSTTWFSFSREVSFYYSLCSEHSSQHWGKAGLFFWEGTISLAPTNS